METTVVKPKRKTLEERLAESKGTALPIENQTQTGTAPEITEHVPDIKEDAMKEPKKECKKDCDCSKVIEIATKILEGIYAHYGTPDAKLTTGASFEDYKKADRVQDVMKVRAWVAKEQAKILLQ